MADSQREAGRASTGRIIGGVGSHGLPDETGQPGPPGRMLTSNAPFNPHFQAQQQRLDSSQTFFMHGQPSGTTANVGQERLEGSFEMGSMAGALPSYRPSPQNFGSSQNQSRLPPGQISPALLQQQQQQQVSQFNTPGMTPPGYSPGYSSQYIPSFPHGQQAPSASSQYFQQQANNPTRSINPSPVHQTYPGTPYFAGQQQSAQPYMFYPAPFGHASPSQHSFQGWSSAYPSHQSRRLSQSYQQGPSRQQENTMNMMSGGFPTQGISPQGGTVAYGYSASGPYLRPGATQAITRKSSGSSVGSMQASVPSAPRGPPRKPKQSGHALWVGNLPPGTKVTDLKDHFSREATNDIESVFLISKSNCAFVNYRTEAACAAAMARFHDSRFQGVRLVCRLRRTQAAPAPGVPTGPAALSPSVGQVQSATQAIQQNREVSSKAEESIRQTGGVGKVNDKYFIVKSLTVEDLELSARTGVWATQAHNEEALNKAFESVENVYLICSANKSGEYFGYARMTSPINDDAAASLDWAPRAEAIPDDPDLPRSIPTAATEFAPKGRIIDDSARGTIFWEAEPLVQEPAPVIDGVDAKVESSADEGDDNPAEAASGPQAFGKPFKIEWLSTNRLPFYRTRGLRNPWNANREVKIARDGTELETSVGRRLVQMFHRPSVNPGMPQPMPGLGMPMVYPPMRPPGPY